VCRRKASNFPAGAEGAEPEDPCVVLTEAWEEKGCTAFISHLHIDRAIAGQDSFRPTRQGVRTCSQHETRPALGLGCGVLNGKVAPLSQSLSARFFTAWHRADDAQDLNGWEARKLRSQCSVNQFIGNLVGWLSSVLFIATATLLWCVAALLVWVSNNGSLHDRS